MTKLKRAIILFSLLILQNLAFAGGADGSGPIPEPSLKNLVLDALSDSGHGVTGGENMSLGHLVTLFCATGGETRYPFVNEQLKSIGCDCSGIAMAGVTQCDRADSNFAP